MKSFIRGSKASGSTKRKVADIYFRRGRYSAKALLRREAAFERQFERARI